MPTSAIASPVVADQPAASVRSVAPLVWLALALGTLWFVCFRHLSAEWSYNEQYNYGWFVPFFALYLFWLRWEDRPPIGGRKSDVRDQTSKVAAVDLNRHRSRLIAFAVAIAALVLLFPIRLIEIANPDWRPISWVHTLIAVTLTLLLIWWMGGRSWLRHFAFPVMFVLVSVPWISAIEGPIIQGLMPTLASIATEALSLFGIPAEVQGNLVRISGGVVGVNEACSGVRSLQTSIMIGLLFGELKRLPVFQRLFLIAGAIAIAFVANCGRAFFLVWIAATRGLTEVEKWHDIAGYTIVALVFFGCLWITSALARAKLESRKVKVETENERTEDGGQRTEGGVAIRNSAFGIPSLHNSITPLLPATSVVVAALLWLLLIEVAVEAWYRAHETNLPKTAQWSVRWPQSAPDFRNVPIDDRARGILHFDKGRGATWRTPLTDENNVASAATVSPVCLLYFFRWEPGHNSALLANAHRPDVCLPATGWRQVGDFGVRPYRVTPELSVPFRHFVFVHDGSGRPQYAHAFYCVWEDRVRPATRNGDLQTAEVQSDASKGEHTTSMAGDPSAWTRNERMEAVFEGRRHLGQQVLEYLSVERREVDVAEAERAFAAQLPRLIAPEAPR